MSDTRRPSWFTDEDHKLADKREADWRRDEEKQKSLPPNIGSDIKEKVGGLNLPLAVHDPVASDENKLNSVFEKIKNQEEVYVHTRFHSGETRHNQDEYQGTGNARVFNKHKREGNLPYYEVTYLAFSLTSPPLDIDSGSRTRRYEAEKVVGMKPDNNSSQWIVYFNVGGDHAVKDTRSGIPLGIGFSCKTQQEAEALLQMFENNLRCGAIQSAALQNNHRVDE